ncbi:MarR family winged helix-turn-helix transcriptional regulator [Achromobacter sp. UMC71]|uniref:MarR family winged helix-turn-helix transcriptional regulator n=1 Tax=Achromobacter sp. UMC71 TaxID=1862320 RepID=UPI0015FF2325|nr:MarR family transcriptional regulator [Achromobacter sp. UMC71]MBB1627274.1 hypothetical protein [Achromobacter sp. UMC71]
MAKETDTPQQQRLSTRIGVVARQWRRAVDQRLQPFDLTQATWLPLVQLARAPGPMRQKELAAALSLDNSAVVRVLQSLEASGFIERLEDPDDRRAKALAITAQGRQLVRRVHTVSAELERELLDGMAPADVDAAHRVLERLGGLLLDLNGGANPRS